MTNPDQALVTRALIAHVTDAIAKELLRFDALSGKAERGAAWDTTTEADRQHYRARARKVLREQEPIALDVAMHRAKQAALASLTPACRIFLTDDARKGFEAAIEAAVAAREAHLMYGKPEQDERIFETVHQIPAPREFTVIDGGKVDDDGDEPFVHPGPQTALGKSLFGSAKAMAATYLPTQDEDIEDRLGSRFPDLPAEFGDNMEGGR